MIFGLKIARSAAKKSEAAKRHVPDGMRVYAVGDVHGRDDLLAEMAGRIEEDLGKELPCEALTVFLGDYVDRGPSSSKVVERLCCSVWPTPLVTLAGNHEDLLRAFLEDERVLDRWRALGGLETIHSYGIDVGQAMKGRDFRALQAAFAASLPDSHRRFLAQLQASFTTGDYFFCHAGVKPGVPLDRQERSDLLNIRTPFLTSEAEHGKLVVHGHTPSTTAEIRPNRIGIDTGAYLTGCLTCIVLEKDERRFLQTGQGRGVKRDEPGLESPGSSLRDL
jgi:serine/threonine protein phosphatase 1